MNESKRKRQSWPEYFMGLAHYVATRSTCDRKHVGCVIVSEDKHVLATGYNGSLPGAPHCDDADHDMHNGHCVRTIHAEMNAVSQAARHGIPLRGAWVFVNTFPCWPCFKVLAASGIVRVFYDDDYRADDRVMRAAAGLGIMLIGPKPSTNPSTPV